jgi:hypothetical protein
LGHIWWIWLLDGLGTTSQTKRKRMEMGAKDHKGECERGERLEACGLPSPGVKR